MNLTPFEQHRARASTLGARIADALTVNKMIVWAHAYEHDMARLGQGAPPLSEALIIHAMWSSVGEYADSGIEA